MTEHELALDVAVQH